MKDGGVVTRTFSIKAIWDDEAKVFISESDIKGLHIEAETIEEFERVMMECAVDLIVANHVPPRDLMKDIRELIPAFMFERPREPLCA